MLAKSYKQVRSHSDLAYIMNPALMPALPRPARARPAMRALGVGTVAQISDPTSKTAIAAMKTTLGGKNEKYFHILIETHTKSRS